jgi:hypothetical protein
MDPATDPTPPAPPAPRKPDALFLSAHVKKGARFVNRVASIANIAEPLLGVDRAKNQRAHIRVQPGHKLFITASEHDTILFPKWHDRDGEPRYDWQKQDDGSEFGYLVDGATPGGELLDA